MAELSYSQIDDKVLKATERPPLLYFIVLLVLGAGILLAAGLWLYQVKYGMGAANIHQPIDWGVYIANFVFWVGIAHSGTLISAILLSAQGEMAGLRFAGHGGNDDFCDYDRRTVSDGPSGPLMGHLLHSSVPQPAPALAELHEPSLLGRSGDQHLFNSQPDLLLYWSAPDLASFRDRCEATLGPSHWKIDILPNTFRRLVRGRRSSGVIMAAAIFISRRLPHRWSSRCTPLSHGTSP